MGDKTSITILENLITQAKSVSDPESAVELINKVVESPQVYSFSEILEVPFFKSVS